MILRSVRLHPYAGIADKTFDFENGLTVVCGPNEEGKTTVAKAVKQVLLQETSLTPKRKEGFLQDLLPVTGGDTVRITLSFSFNGIEYTLKKQWGPACSTELIDSNMTAITDPNTVQEKLREMLPANYAVVEQVLIANQSELANAVGELTEDVTSSLSDQLRDAVIKGGGISISRLQETVS